MANLDYLATGNSAIETTFGNEAEQDDKLEAISEQQHVLTELLPSVEYIRTVIKQETAVVSDIRAYIKTLGDNPKGTEIQAEYRARELYIGFLSRLSDNVENMVANAEAEASK